MPSNIVFVDARVDNFQSLLSGLESNTEAVILDPTQDGISQITEFLRARLGVVDSVQILGHGSAGSLQIGSTELSSSNLEKYQQSLQQWFSPLLNKRPDLILYGCEVGSGLIGDNFIQRLSAITGADVAASIDLTGSAAKGGNWILEKATGIIEAGQAFTQAVRDAYQYVLAVYTVTNTNDAGSGSLREAITLANANPGGDLINFNIAPGGPQTIRVGSTTGGVPLPYISDTVFINGETQPGFSDTNTPIIVLDGSAVSSAIPNLDGLRFVKAPPTVFPGYGGPPITSGDSSGSIVQGLVIGNFSGNGIKLGQADGYSGGAGPDNIVVRRNYVGTDITGTVAKPNSTWGDPNNTHAIHIYNSNSAQIRNNLVSGNFTSTITFRGPSTNSIVDGNIVGTDVSGRFALANQRWGLYTISAGVSNLTLTNNLISANGLQDDASGLPGVDVRGSGTVTGNTIGTDITGTYALNNRGNAFNYSGTATVTGNTINGGRVGFTPAMNAANPNPGLPAAVAPTLAGGSPLLSAIPQDSTSNNGTLVRDMVGGSIGNFLPVPTPGIAITAFDNTNGTWQYSTDNGGNWANVNLNFPTTPAGGYNVWLNSGYPAPNNPAVAPDVVGALLLAADNKSRLRFIPNAGYTGTANGVTYRAWNQRYGGNGEMINISGMRRTVASMAIINNNMSPNSNTSRINVLPVNTAPILNPLQVLTSGGFIAAVGTTTGALVSNILATSVTDPDPGSQRGIAITNLDSNNGTWQYSINGQHWIPIVGASVTSAASLLLDSTSRLRFIPNSGYVGLPGAVTLRAWDQTNGVNGSQIDATTNGGNTSVSALDVTLLNTAPVLDPLLVPTNKTQASIESGVLVGDFAASAITDVDVANLKGIAITDAPNVDGVWQYSLDAGVSWLNVGAVSPTNARLLGFNSLIRFASNVELTKTISFRAWDQTSGVPGGLINVSINGGTTSFSNQQGSIDIKVLRPVINNSGLSAELLALLRNPPAPDAPTAVVVGTPPSASEFDVSLPPQESFANPNPPVSTFDNSPMGNSPLADDDCPCETVIKQEKPNPIVGTIRGTDEKDSLVGTPDANTVFGLKGKDMITGTPEMDNLYGGPGGDTIQGLEKRDFIRGGGGKDTLYGGKGQDVIFGGKGNDRIFGGRDGDFLSGGDGDDIIFGGQGNNVDPGANRDDSGNDFISGGKGNDRLIGQDDDDTICGCEGNDLLRGGKGNDTLNGGKGRDILVGGFGNDILTGGAGRDRFRLAPGTGTDTITDFTIGKDAIELVKGLKFSDLQITQGVGATVIGLQPGTLFPSDKPLALLTGVAANTLTPNSFITI